MELLGHKHQNCHSLIIMMEVELKRRDSRGGWGEKRKRAEMDSEFPIVLLRFGRAITCPSTTFSKMCPQSWRAAPVSPEPSLEEAWAAQARRAVQYAQRAGLGKEEGLAKESR